jgi:hypothetical protein
MSRGHLFRLRRLLLVRAEFAFDAYLYQEVQFS